MSTYMEKEEMGCCCTFYRQLKRKQRKTDDRGQIDEALPLGDDDLHSLVFSYGPCPYGHVDNFARVLEKNQLFLNFR